jgi:hypothetical protein
MRYQRDVTRVALLFAAALASAALTTAALGPVVLAGAAATCVNLKVDAATRRALIQAHDRLTPRPFTGPRKGSVYYGRCGSTRYALASFRDRTLGYQDQPERFRKRRGERWRDLGDTGGDVCRAAPRALIRIWALRGC